MARLEGFSLHVLTYITNVGRRRVRRDNSCSSRTPYIALVLVTVSHHPMTVAANG